MLLKLNRIGDGEDDDVRRLLLLHLLLRFSSSSSSTSSSSPSLSLCSPSWPMRANACSRQLLSNPSASASPRDAGALIAGGIDPKASQATRSPSGAPAATRPVCGNIYTGAACTRPLLRPCTPLRGSRSPPRFLKIHRDIQSVDYRVHQQLASPRAKRS